MNKFYLLGGSFKDDSLYIKDIRSKNLANSVLFIDSANNYRFDNENRFKDKFSPYFNEINVLDLTKDIKEQFKHNDVIYFNGGKTESLVEEANKYHFIDIIKELDDKVIIGTSAGAILFFKEGYGDLNVYYDNLSYYGFDFVSSIGIFNYIFCPHYNKKGILSFNERIKEKNLDGIALTDGALLKIVDNKISVIKEKGAQAFIFKKNNDYKLEIFTECKLKD